MTAVSGRDPPAASTDLALAATHEHTPREAEAARDGGATLSSGPPDGGAAGPHAAPGVILEERYELVRCLGRGGMGEVWLARHTTLDQDVAIKLLAAPAPTGTMARERFLREARASAGLRHPGIVYVQDFGTIADDHPYIVMEFLAGESLAAKIAEGALQWPEVVTMLEAIAAALSFAHSRGVVHRDLKPSNIFLAEGPDGDVQLKVIDFGIAKLCGDELAADGMSTQTGVIVGTPAYMSPEQISDAPVDARADLYSLGCVAYEMLTGAVPFMGSSTALLVKHVSEHPPAPSVRAPQAGIPADVDAIVLRLLRKKPENRFASCGELRDALSKVATGAPPVDVPSEPLSPVFEARLMSGVAAAPGGRPTSPGQLPLILGIALVSAGVAALATLAVGGREGAREEVGVEQAAQAAPEPATSRARRRAKRQGAKGKEGKEGKERQEDEDEETEEATEGGDQGGVEGTAGSTTEDLADTMSEDTVELPAMESTTTQGEPEPSPADAAPRKPRPPRTDPEAAEVEPASGLELEPELEPDPAPAPPELESEPSLEPDAADDHP
jgi:serine/threonine-protein kinase